ncbi:uncharacterized protein LOC116214296 isoform X2 [Punica granatum]|uniref:Uncharacterized protein LOC116214296 isoform X2 n=1 Tax=Punica granatum TaxID=22663 RepID=A0A6P8EFJ2_PUNGR|nr:uncharacterized protein LOC116214296 isoform X2 [Punica granatum]
MEEPIKEQSSVSGNGGKSTLQRYALRSAAKSKEEKAEPVNASASRRARPLSAVSKSVGVLDLSGKDKPAKPPRRQSIPAKSSAGSTAKLVGNITPISETRARRSANSQVKSETPLSDVSRSSSRRRFSVLSSASYWLQQIKLSETAAKHSVSLGFFKLALEAGCEPQKMREELKSYVRKHSLPELKEAVKELFDIFNIVESVEQPQVSQTCSQVPEEGTRSSDDDVHSTSSTIGARKIKPKSLNNDVALASQVAAEPDKETLKKNPATKVRESVNRNPASSRTVPDNGARKVQKKVQKPMKEGSNVEKEKTERQGKKPAVEGGQDATPPAQDVTENKENLDAPPLSST